MSLILDTTQRSVLLAILMLVLLLAGTSRAEIDVWIDPGHGGNDPGALGFNGPAEPNEKELVIGVTTFLQGDLTGLGYDAHKTKNADTTYFNLLRRRLIANGEAPNDIGVQDSCRLFLSIHMDSVEDDTIIGTRTFYPTIKYDATNRNAFQADLLAAQTIHPDVIANAAVAFLFCHNDRGIEAENYAVLRRTRSPALLLELCFISNECQFNNISNAGDQALIADGIAAGVSGHLMRTPQPPPHASEHPTLTVLRSTGSSPAGAVLDQGFDDPTFPPTGWSIETAGLPVPHAWHRTTDPAYVATGTGAALVGAESPSAIDEWLISPGVTIGATDDAVAFLWSGSQIWSDVLDASLSVREVGTTPWTELWSIAADEPPADPFLYRERIVDLSAWIGLDVELGFRVVGTDGAEFVLDEVRVGDFEPTAPAPNDVCANAIVLGSPFDIQDVTCYAANDLDPYTPPPGSCVGNTLLGPDIFYELNAVFADTLRATLTTEWGGALYLIDDCGTPTCIAGGYSEDGRTTASLDLPIPLTGTYYLVVDGDEGSCGPFQLTGELVSSAVSVPPAGSLEPSVAMAATPNPATGGVRLTAAVSSGSLPASALVEVFDIAGARVWQKHVPVAGSEVSVVWDGRDDRGARVPPGTYFARVTVGSTVARTKVTLAR